MKGATRIRAYVGPGILLLGISLAACGTTTATTTSPPATAVSATSPASTPAASGTGTPSTAATSATITNGAGVAVATLTLSPTTNKSVSTVCNEEGTPPNGYDLSFSGQSGTQKYDVLIDYTSDNAAKSFALTDGPNGNSPPLPESFLSSIQGKSGPRYTGYAQNTMRHASTP